MKLYLEQDIMNVSHGIFIYTGIATIFPDLTVPEVYWRYLDDF